MRKKRYFAAEVMHSSAMRALPTGAVVAYMDLCLAADDDGFVYDPVGTARASGGSETEFEMLCAAGFVLRFENCALIRHWFGQNPKNKWRHTPTAFTEELAKVELSADGVWNLKQGAAPVNGEVSTQVITDVTAPVSAQVPAEVISPARTENGAGGEDRQLTALPKAAETERMADRTAERIAPVTSQVTAGVISPVLSQVTSEGIHGVPPSRAYDNNNNNNKNNFSYRYSDHSESGFKPPTVEEVRAYCQGEGLCGVDAQYFTDYYAAKGWRIGSSPMADWRAVARNWQLKSKERKRDAPPEKPPMRPLYKILT